MAFERRCHKPSLSIVRSYKKTSRSFCGLSLAGMSTPKMDARTKISGLRPHHLPKPVNVWLATALRSLYDSFETKDTGNCVSIKVLSVIGIVGKSKDDQKEN